MGQQPQSSLMDHRGAEMKRGAPSLDGNCIFSTLVWFVTRSNSTCSLILSSFSITSKVATSVWHCISDVLGVSFFFFSVFFFFFATTMLLPFFLLFPFSRVWPRISFFLLLLLSPFGSSIFWMESKLKNVSLVWKEGRKISHRQNYISHYIIATTKIG